jgi:hypothetical protein
MFGKRKLFHRYLRLIQEPIALELVGGQGILDDGQRERAKVIDIKFIKIEKAIQTLIIQNKW